MWKRNRPKAFITFPFECQGRIPARPEIVAVFQARCPYVFTVVSTCVAAAILAAVEGGILPPGMVSLSEELTAKPTRISAGQDARLYGRQDACRYGKHVRKRRTRRTGILRQYWRAPEVQSAVAAALPPPPPASALQAATH